MQDLFNGTDAKYTTAKVFRVREVIESDIGSSFYISVQDSQVTCREGPLNFF
jgi:hypothetical protein